MPSVYKPVAGHGVWTEWPQRRNPANLQGMLSTTRLRLQPPALYAAFDVFPSAKGAAVHIDRFARCLFEFAGGGLLHVLGNGFMPPYQREGDVEILRYSDGSGNFLRRSLNYGRHLDRVLDGHGADLRLCHFRDPWSGVPVLRQAGQTYKTLYEVNGLPSIELPYAYAAVAPETLKKIRAVEDFCLERSDLIVTPARGIAANLEARGVDGGKIRVIPNGADLAAEKRPLAPVPWPYLLYFGAVQPWQGIETLLHAFSRLLDFQQLHLVICASVPRRRTKPYRRLVRRLGLGARVHWEYALSQTALEPWRRNALLSVAPLSECSRNLEQGCSPLKILESMAAGLPVVASDLPPVRELMEDGVHGSLVPPDRPAELARAIRILLEYPQLREGMGAEGRRHIRDHFNWELALQRLQAVYKELSPSSAQSQ